MKKKLRLHKSTMRVLSRGEIQNAAGGMVGNTTYVMDSCIATFRAPCKNPSDPCQSANGWTCQPNTYTLNPFG